MTTRLLPTVLVADLNHCEDVVPRLLLHHHFVGNSSFVPCA
jgi:hypothetical protein